MTDAAFLQQFGSLALPLEQWTDRAHLHLWRLRRRSKALVLLRKRSYLEISGPLERSTCVRRDLRMKFQPRTKIEETQNFDFTHAIR